MVIKWSSQRCSSVHKSGLEVHRLSVRPMALARQVARQVVKPKCDINRAMGDLHPQSMNVPPRCCTPQAEPRAIRSGINLKYIYHKPVKVDKIDDASLKAAS
jgi:hypothetical protein